MGKTKSLIIVANAFERERQRKTDQPASVMWTRPELTTLLNVYGRHVAAGAWRDYAMADGRQAALFDIFRTSSEMPLYRVEKIPALRRKQGQYVLKGMDGQILRRGHDLQAVLKFFERKNLRLIG